MTIIVLPTISREKPDRVDRLKKRLMKLRQVRRLYHVTGDADFVLTVVCDSMADYVTFTETHFYEPDIKGFDCIVVMREYTSEAETGR